MGAGQWELPSGVGCSRNRPGCRALAVGMHGVGCGTHGVGYCVRGGRTYLLGYRTSMREASVGVQQGDETMGGAHTSSTAGGTGS